MQGRYNTRSPAVKRLMKEAQELSEPTDQYYAQPLEDNLFEWHFTVRGPADSEFQHGVYHGRIILPVDYPMKPPSIIWLTPNGRFETNKKICLSISGHHPESWQPSWSIRTALLAIIGFMPTHGGGAIGSLDYTAEERKILAKRSRDWRCPQCGDVSKLLLERTTESAEAKDASEEVKKLAAQINFQDACWLMDRFPNIGSVMDRFTHFGRTMNYFSNIGRITKHFAIMPNIMEIIMYHLTNVTGRNGTLNPLCLRNNPIFLTEPLLGYSDIDKNDNASSSSMDDHQEFSPLIDNVDPVFLQSDETGNENDTLFVNYLSSADQSLERDATCSKGNLRLGSFEWAERDTTSNLYRLKTCKSAPDLRKPRKRIVFAEQRHQPFVPVRNPLRHSQSSPAYVRSQPILIHRGHFDSPRAVVQRIEAMAGDTRVRGTHRLRRQQRTLGVGGRRGRSLESSSTLIFLAIVFFMAFVSVLLAMIMERVLIIYRKLEEAEDARRFS